LDGFPVFVADVESLPRPLFVAAMVENEAVEVGKGGIGVYLEFKDEILLFVADECESECHGSCCLMCGD